MGACATKSGDLKNVKGEPPLVVEDAVAPRVAEGEKAKADGVPVAAETTDPADVSRRRSLSDLLKEDAEASDEEAGQDAVKVVAEDSVVAADVEAGAPESVSEEAEAAKAPPVAVQPSDAVVEQDAAAEQPTDGSKTGQEPSGEVQEAEEDKRVDPDSVQVASVAAAAADATVAAPSTEGSAVADGASA